MTDIKFDDTSDMRMGLGFRPPEGTLESEGRIYEPIFLASLHKQKDVKSGKMVFKSYGSIFPPRRTMTIIADLSTLFYDPKDKRYTLSYRSPSELSEEGFVPFYTMIKTK